MLQLFVEYYKKQGVVPEGQWDEFMELLKTTLTTTFRINGTGKFATDLRDKLESDFLSNFNKDPIMVWRSFPLLRLVSKLFGSWSPQVLSQYCICPCRTAGCRRDPAAA